MCSAAGHAEWRPGIFCRGPRTMMAVSQAHQEPEAMADRPVTIEDLARAQRAEPVADPGELAADIWESDADWRRSWRT